MNDDDDDEQERWVNAALGPKKDQQACLTCYRNMVYHKGSGWVCRNCDEE